MDTRRFKKSST